MSVNRLHVKKLMPLILHVTESTVYKTVIPCMVSVIVAPARSTAHSFFKPCSVSTGTVAILVSGIIMCSYQGDRLSQISSPSNGSFYSQLPDYFVTQSFSLAE